MRKVKELLQLEIRQGPVRNRKQKIGDGPRV
jgi:hypothetical protein